LKIVLNIFSRAFIALYAILTLIAVIAEMKEIGFQSIHLLYFIGAILFIGNFYRLYSWKFTIISYYNSYIDYSTVVFNIRLLSSLSK